MFNFPHAAQLRMVILFLMLITASFPTFAEASLAGFWKFDEGEGELAGDAVGNANPGRAINGPVWVRGAEGSALSFPGKDDSVEVPHSEGIDFGAVDESYAVSFWFCSSTPPSKIPDSHFITKFGPAYPFSFVQAMSGELQFRTYDGAICATAESGMDFSDGDWHFVAGVRDGSKRRLLLYVDGYLAASAIDTTKGELRNDGPLRIGRSHGDDFNGLIDEVKLYRGLPSRADIQPPLTQPERPIDVKPAVAPARIPAKRAEGVPAMRKLVEGWSPTLAGGGETACAKESGAAELKNAWMAVMVSAESGEITSLVSRGKQLLSEPAGVAIKDVLTGAAFQQNEGKVVDFKVVDKSPESVTAIVRKQYAEGYAATITYTLGSQALCCDARLETDFLEARECRIDFNIPMLSAMTKLFWTREGAPFDIAEPPAEILVYRQSSVNTAMVLPSLTAYDAAGDVGLSFVAPFDLPKPGLHFKINTQEKRLGLSYLYLRLAKNEPARAAVYVVPHEGCWRPSLAWMLETYPDYFKQDGDVDIETPGWYWLGGPLEDRETVEGLRARGSRLFQIHNHFPFYGLYMPETESWDVVVGLADQGKANLADWEEGKDQGGYANSYDQMRKAIDARQESGMQALLYLQSFELWDQYARKYYADDIAMNRMGQPHTAWTNCSLMNPDPSFAWGRNIIAQFKKIPEKYPSLAGVFYDRDDYKQYDYAHDDGISMIGGLPCYPLSLAQQQINEVITSILHEHGMSILTNGPTSIEVCKGIDGVMCETNGWAACLQYLGLVRPVVLLPFYFDSMSYDRSPAQTEEKMKVALSMGLYPALTFGDADSQRIDRKFQPLFEWMKDREWVLRANALALPEGLQGNIFHSPAGDYMVTVVDFARSQLHGDRTPQSVNVIINAPEAASIKYCYALSGDYMGVTVLPFSCEGAKLTVTLPCHLACSMLVLSDEPRFEIARSSTPLFQMNQNNTILFEIHNSSGQEKIRSLIARSPWSEVSKQITMKGGELQCVPVEMGVPAAIQEGQMDIGFTVELDGTVYEMSGLLAPPPLDENSAR